MSQLRGGAEPLVGGAIPVLMPLLLGSQGSVQVDSTLVFGRGNGSVTSTAAERQLRSSLDPNGFIMDLQLADIQSELWAGAGWSPTGVDLRSFAALPHPG